MNRKAIIFGIKGYTLTKKEKIFFRKTKPWGIILFSRNIKSISQLRNLILDIKKCFGKKKYPILIDSEGGKVSRLNNIIDLSIFSQNYFEKLYRKDKKLFLKYYKIYIDTVSNILRDVGININTVPVLDVRRENAHAIIGSRSFSKNPKIVSTMGKICINYYKKNRIATVIKHIPGHGLAKVDSHKLTPIVEINLKDLIERDFLPFKKLNNQPFAMIAHIIYSKIDSSLACTSQFIIKNIIKKKIRFKGLLISDDINMILFLWSRWQNL